MYIENGHLSLVGISPNLNESTHTECWQVLNPLDAICHKPRREAICVSQLRNAGKVDQGILQERPDVKIFLPFRFYFYKPAELFKPDTYNSFLGKYYNL